MEVSDQHLSDIKKQLAEYNGTIPAIKKSIEEIHQLIKSANAPNRTIDEYTLTTFAEKFTSYDYPYNYLFVDDSDSGTVLTVSDRVRSHAITLNGGWNLINSIDAWWSSSKMINVLLLRSSVPIVPSV